jgi:hypothetical protein
VLVRDLGQSRPAAALAGTFYAFCPFRFAQIAHIQMVCTGWLPLAAWGLHRYFATLKRHWLAVAVAAAALQALSNSYVAYFMAVPLGFVALDGLRARPERWRTIAVDLAAATIALAVILAPVALAYYRARATYEQVRTPEEIARGGADVRAYVIAVNGVWRRWLPEAGLGDIEKQLFPGLVAPLLAGLGIVAAWGRRGDRRRWIVLYAAIAVAGFLCSLGPQVRLWGSLVTTHGPYEWIQAVLPGMGGMRVPARFAIVFMFGLAVVAGCGAGALLSDVRRSLRLAILGALLVGIVADGWAAPLTVVAYPGGGRPEDRAVADWLSRAPVGAVLHLPVRTNDFQELNYQYATLRHEHQMLNGYSGYSTPLQDYFRDPRSPLYDYDRFGATVTMLRRLGIRFVVLHDRDYSAAQIAEGEQRRMLEGLHGSGQVQREARLLGAEIFELQPWPDPGGAETPRTIRIPPDEFTLSASEESGRLAALVDGDPDTRWIGRQEGSSWVEVRFRRPHDVAQLGLQLASRSLSDFPRLLQIDAQDDRGETRVLYRSSPYPEFIVGFVSNPAYPRLDVQLPANRTVTLTIREVAAYHDWWWSIHELAVRERAGGPDRPGQADGDSRAR